MFEGYMGIYLILAAVSFALGLWISDSTSPFARRWSLVSALAVASLLLVYLVLKKVLSSDAKTKIKNLCGLIEASLKAAPTGLERDSAVQLAQEIASDSAEASAMERLANELRDIASRVPGVQVQDDVDRLIEAIRAEQSDEIKKSRRHITAFAVAAGVLWIILGLVPLVVVWFKNDSNPGFFENGAALTPRPTHSTWSTLIGIAGTIGDSFGAVNALFSALALSGAIYSVWLQRHELRMQREEMAVNRRELARSADAQVQSKRSFELQTRLAAYQSLAEHHRFTRECSDDDKLLYHRSIGRANAYAELVEMALQDIDAFAAGAFDLPSSQFSPGDHPNRIGFLYNRFQRDERVQASPPKSDFTPIERTMLELVEEIALLTVLNRDNEIAKVFLLQAGHCVNAAVEPRKRLLQYLTAKELDRLGDGFLRDYQMEHAGDAMVLAVGAIDSLRDRTKFTFDTRRPPDQKELVSMVVWSWPVQPPPPAHQSPKVDAPPSV